MGRRTLLLVAELILLPFLFSFKNGTIDRHHYRKGIKQQSQICLLVQNSHNPEEDCICENSKDWLLVKCNESFIKWNE